MMFECPLCGSHHRKVRTLFNHYINEHNPTKEEFDKFVKEIQDSLQVGNFSSDNMTKPDMEED